MLDPREIPGQKDIIAQVEGALATGRLAPAWLLHGPEGTGKWALAHALAAALLCREPTPWACGACPACRRVAAFSHGDLFLLFGVPTGGGSGKARDRFQAEYAEAFLQAKRELPLSPYSEARNRFIPAERLGELLSWAYLRPGEGKRKVVVIYEAELLVRTMVDKLLKFSEEPPPDTHLILVSHNPEGLPLTIRSRARQIRFRRTGPKALTRFLTTAGADPAAAAEAARQARGCVGFALRRLAEQDDSNPEKEALLLLAGLVAPTSRVLSQVQLWQWRAERQRAHDALEVWAALVRDLAVQDHAEPLLAGVPPELAGRMAALAEPEVATQALDLIRNTQRALATNVHIGVALVALARRLACLGRGARQDDAFWPAPQKV